MDVSVQVRSGRGDFEVSLSISETNGEAWGNDQSHIDRVLDEAVSRIKRAYWVGER